MRRPIDRPPSRWRGRRDSPPSRALALQLANFGLPSDCVLHASMDVTSATNWFPGPTQAWTPFTIPALPPSLIGLQIHVQSATLTTFGLGPTPRVSNGLQCTIGTM